jgi:membrane protein DedA with SNARE-associated domain
MSDQTTAVLVVAMLLLVKESGLPIPVPGDLLVIGSGVAAAGSAGLPVLAAVLVVLATIAGGAIQFGLIRGPGRRAMLRFLGRLGVSEARLQSRTNGLASARSVALGRMTPGLRVAVIPAAAIGPVPRGTFLAGLAAGNAVFVGGHFLLGYLVGEPALTLASRTMGPIAVGILVLAVIGGAGWWLLGRARALRGEAGSGEAGVRGTRVTGVAAWADAACPACLALAVVAPGLDRRPA